MYYEIPFVFPLLVMVPSLVPNPPKPIFIFHNSTATQNYSVGYVLHFLWGDKFLQTLYDFHSLSDAFGTIFQVYNIPSNTFVWLAHFVACYSTIDRLQQIDRCCMQGLAEVSRPSCRRVKMYPVASRDFFFWGERWWCKARIYWQKLIKLWFYQQRCKFTDRSKFF